MMMQARENIQRVLEQTGLYRFTPGGVLASEMAAYEAGFAILEEKMESLLADLFTETASRAILDEKEEAFRHVPALADLPTRRRMLLARYGDFAENSGAERYRRLLTAAGIEGSLAEDTQTGKLTVTISRLLGLSREQALLELGELFPAHAEIEIIE